MELLYSNILPLKKPEGKELFTDAFMKAIEKSDEVDIAVGYVSKASLRELGEQVERIGIKNICLIIGMYYLEGGMPEGTYHEAVTLNEKWKQAGIGEVRIVRTVKYHGKLYLFKKDGKPFEGFIGSHNLGAIKSEASNIRQYEISAKTINEDELQEMEAFIDELKLAKCSLSIDEIVDMPMIREINRALVDQEFVSKVTMDEVSAYQDRMTETSFEIPLKVPENAEDTRMRGSNINVCYAKGRKRVWWETEIVVGKEIKELPGYPEWGKPFMAITDDGWRFQVWTCGQNNKNLYSKDDLKIMGRWIKGRLVAAGLVDPVNTVENDTEGKGVITHEMLLKYGRDTITLTKTDLTTKADDGTELDVWVLSFLPESKHRKEN